MIREWENFLLARKWKTVQSGEQGGTYQAVFQSGETCFHAIIFLAGGEFIGEICPASNFRDRLIYPVKIESPEGLEAALEELGEKFCRRKSWRLEASRSDYFSEEGRRLL